MQRLHYGEHPSQFVELFEVPEARCTVISIHGGYWREKYGLDLNQPMVDHLVKLGFTVANIEYRRITGDTGEVWGEMSSDVLAAISIVENSSGPIVLLGHSAGGQLALWAAAQSTVQATAVVALAPLSDLFLADGLELSDHATRDLFGANAAERPDLFMAASPLHLLPLGVPQLIVHGRADEDVPFEMAGDYIETAEALGEDIRFLDPKRVDHFDVINPGHAVWSSIDEWLATKAFSR